MNFTKLILLFCFFWSCSHQVPEKVISLYPDREPANFQTCFQSMEEFFKPIPESTEKNVKFQKTRDLSELEISYANDSFIDLQKNIEQNIIKKNNNHIFELLNHNLPISTSKEWTTYITQAEANKIFKAVKNSKVNENNAMYDPTGKTGFCFGRATIVHMEALVRGVHPDSIKKIWIAGDMEQWGHHVATMIKGKNGWYVIDTENEQVVSPLEWFQFHKQTKKKGSKTLMIFVSRADRFGPYDSSAYSGVNLFNTNTDEFNRSSDFYRGYFHDYFSDLEEDIERIKKFPIR